MTSPSRRYRKLFALLLLLLQVSGTRVVVADEPCGRGGCCFTASLSFKAVAWAASRRRWNRDDPGPLGVAKVHRHGADLDSFWREDRFVSAAPAPARLPSAAVIPGARASRGSRLATDLIPVQPPHLHSKK